METSISPEIMDERARTLEIRGRLIRHNDTLLTIIHDDLGRFTHGDRLKEADICGSVEEELIQSLQRAGLLPKPPKWYIPFRRRYNRPPTEELIEMQY